MSERLQIDTDLLQMQNPRCFIQAGLPRPTQDLLQCCTRAREQLAQFVGEETSAHGSAPSSNLPASFSAQLALAISISSAALL